MAESVLLSTFSNDIDGILPLGKSSLSQWHGWVLPGHGDSRVDCGKLYTKGCLEVGLHHGEHEGKAYFKRVARSCKRAACPVCYEKWASREGHRAVRRMSYFKTGYKPIHVIVSPSPADIELSYDDLKDKMYSLVKRVGIFGGMSIIHPWRSLCDLCQHDKEHCSCGDRQIIKWYVSPHFHLICYGWVNGSAVGSVFNDSGWIIKNLGKRDTLAGTITYQLSHAGVSNPSEGYCPAHGDDKESCRLAREFPFGNAVNCSPSLKGHKHSTITWFGVLSYNKLHVPKESMDDKPLCPVCESPLREVVFTMYDADFSDLIEGYEWFDDPGGWEYLDKGHGVEPVHVSASWSDLKVADELA